MHVDARNQLMCRSDEAVKQKQLETVLRVHNERAMSQTRVDIHFYILVLIWMQTGVQVLCHCHGGLD